MIFRTQTQKNTQKNNFCVFFVQFVLYLCAICFCDYNNNGNPTTQITYFWENNVWEESWKVEYEFDLSVSISDVISNISVEAAISEDFGAIEYSNKVTNLKFYNRINNAWIETENWTFHYFQIPTNIPNITENSFTIFPNPVFDNFTISGITENALVKITDLNGRVVLQQMVSPNEQILVSHLSAGVYFVRVNEEVVRIVKQ